MPGPGSRDALVLPPNLPQEEGEPTAGRRAHDLLTPFLDARRYSAMAVVHGTSDSAAFAFDLVKRRLRRTYCLAWLTDPTLVDALEGRHAAALRTMLARDGVWIVTFASVGLRRRVAELSHQSLFRIDVDEAFREAARA